MKKSTFLILILPLLASVLFVSSCKKTGDPGPAGANGTNGINGSFFPYKQEGTTLNLSGNFSSDDVSFNNLFRLPFFSSLEESSMEEHLPALRTEGTQRTSADGLSQYFYVTRYDSLNNSFLDFEIENDYEGEITVNNFQFNVKSNIDGTGYRKVYTTGYYGGQVRTSSPYDYGSGLDSYDLENDGNSFEITHWNYNSSTRVLSFDYNGVLTGAYNSTENDLTVSGTVKANLKKESLRRGQ